MDHPDAVQWTIAEIDAFCAELPVPTAAPADEFIAELTHDGRTRLRRSGALTSARSRWLGIQARRGV